MTEEITFKVSLWLTVNIPRKTLQEYLARGPENEMTEDESYCDLAREFFTQSTEIMMDARDNDSWSKGYVEIDEVEIEEKPTLPTQGE